MSAKLRPGRGFVVICLLGLAFILYTRLIPFDFTWDGRIPFERLTWRPLTLRDVPLNILLFVPFGFGLAGVLARHGRPKARGHVLAAAILLSATLEAIQMFLPERVPSLADVSANALGALLGYGLFRAWSMDFGRALERYATRRNLLAGLALYALGVALLTAYLYRSVQLSNWDASFPLVVGNEAVGKRQWSGWVGSLALEAGTSGGSGLFIDYDLKGDAPFEEVHQYPAAPPLEWREGPVTPQDDEGITVGPGEWLATGDPVMEFSSTARDTDAFGIEMDVASADPGQRGPARIASISADAERRNVTIGQEFDALIIRLRTPAAGENGQKPELIVPGVFAGSAAREIIVHYDAPMLWVEVDGEEYSLSLAPGAAFFPGFMTENRWTITLDGNPRRYDLAYWGLVIVLGAVLFGGAAAARRLARTAG